MKSKYGIEPDNLHRLEAELSRRHQEHIPADYWHGYLTAVSLSPTAIPEREWIPLVLGAESDNESAEIEQQLRDALGAILDALSARELRAYFPGDDGDWRSCQMTQWCDGFLTAANLWPADLQDLAAGELMAMILPVILFHNPDEFFQTQHGYRSEEEREEMMDKSFAFLHQGLYELPGLWKEVLQEEEAGEGD